MRHQDTSAAQIKVADAWRSALWILEALPAMRRPTAPLDPTPLRERKLVKLVERLWHCDPIAGRALQEHVLPGVPFDQCIRWWAERHEVAAPSLDHCMTIRIAAGGRLIASAGSIPSAHAILRSVAIEKVTDRDVALPKARSAIRSSESCSEPADLQWSVRACVLQRSASPCRATPIAALRRRRLHRAPQRLDRRRRRPSATPPELRPA